MHGFSTRSHDHLNSDHIMVATFIVRTQTQITVFSQLEFVKEVRAVENGMYSSEFNSQLSNSVNKKLLVYEMT